MAARLALLAAALLLTPAVLLAKGKDRLPRPKRSAEFKYVDEPDDAKAAEMLPKLLKKYDTPKKCVGLLKVLRTKRSYPSKMPKRHTLAHRCGDGKSRQFTWILPKKYSKRKPVGVMFFLHGAIRQPAPGGGANEAGMFAPAVRDLNLIVVGPSTYGGVEWGTPACRELFHHALQFLKQHFNVDENRVYIAGDSDGGRGTYAMVETEATFLASAVPVIGAPGGVTRFANLGNLPWFAINGETDTIFRIDNVRRIVKQMQESGIDLEWKLLEGKGHDPRFFLTYKDEVCAFFEAHPRDPFPKRVHWQVDTSAGEGAQAFPANTMRWLRIVETGSSRSRGDFGDAGGPLVRGGMPRVEGRYEGNRIDVQTQGVTKYAVLVSDEMLDLEKPVEIHTNGKESFRGLVEANAEVILEEARRFKDRKLVFVNRIQVEVGE
jgi:hypothetical protein